MTLDAANVQLTVRGDVGPRLRDYAREKVARVARYLPDPVLFARVKLTVEPDPARERPVIAKATLDVNGVLVRAQVAGHDVREAADLLEAKLRDAAGHLHVRRQARRKRGPAAREPHEWHHGDASPPRPPFFDRPVEQREVVRRKTFALHALRPEEAVDEMDLLGYDFHLFVCSETGSACLVERLADGRLLLRSAGSPPAAPDPFVVDPLPVPHRTEEEAAEYLDATGRSHEFFVLSGSGRAAVLYRRYDGHYGLVMEDGGRPETGGRATVTAASPGGHLAG